MHLLVERNFTEHTLFPFCHTVPSLFKETYCGVRNAVKYLNFRIIIFFALQNMKIHNRCCYCVFWTVWSDHLDWEDINFKYMKTKCWLPKTYGECSLYHHTLYHGLRYTTCMIMFLKVCVNCSYTGCMLNLYPDTIIIMRVCFIWDLKIICSEELCNMVSGNTKIIQNFGKEITLRTQSNFKWVVYVYQQCYFGQVRSVSVGFCVCDVQVLSTDFVKMVEMCRHLQTSTLINLKWSTFITALHNFPPWT